MNRHERRALGLPSAGQKPEVYCHTLIKATAIEMAGELYDLLMKDDNAYKEWKAVCPDLTPTKLEIMFIEQTWPKLVEQARGTLASMLDASCTLPQDQKDIIAEALILDNTLPGRKRGQGLRLN